MATLKLENINAPFGASFRIGYRLLGSGNSYTYLSNYPGPNDIPYSWTVPPAGTPYEIEVTVICPNCSGGIYSDPVVVTAVATP